MYVKLNLEINQEKFNFLLYYSILRIPLLHAM